MKAKRFSMHRRALAALVLCLTFGGYADAAFSAADDFNDSARDTRLWHVHASFYGMLADATHRRQ